MRTRPLPFFQMTYKEHIHALAQEHEIDLYWFDDCDPDDVAGWARPAFAEVRIFGPSDDEWTYLLALHEIGHVAARWRPSTLEKEWAAWEWAFEHAAFPISPETIARTWATLSGRTTRTRSTRTGSTTTTTSSRPGPRRRLRRARNANHGEADL